MQLVHRSGQKWDKWVAKMEGKLKLEQDNYTFPNLSISRPHFSTLFSEENVNSNSFFSSLTSRATFSFHKIIFTALFGIHQLKMTAIKSRFQLAYNNPSEDLFLNEDQIAGTQTTCHSQGAELDTHVYHYCELWAIFTPLSRLPSIHRSGALVSLWRHGGGGRETWSHFSALIFFFFQYRFPVLVRAIAWINAGCVGVVLFRSRAWVIFTAAARDAAENCASWSRTACFDECLSVCTLDGSHYIFKRNLSLKRIVFCRISLINVTEGGKMYYWCLHQWCLHEI